MTWKIINMVRSGGGNCSSGQRSAAAAAVRQCCRLTVKNIPPSPVSEMRFLPCTGAPLASPPHHQRRTPRPWCGFPSQTRPPAATAARLVTVPTDNVVFYTIVYVIILSGANAVVYYNIITIIIMREVAETVVGGKRSPNNHPSHTLTLSLCLSRAKVYMQKFSRVGGRCRRLFSGCRR